MVLKRASLCFAVKKNILDVFLADIQKHLPCKIVFEMAELWEQQNKEKINPPPYYLGLHDKLFHILEVAIKEERQPSMQILVKSLFNVYWDQQTSLLGCGWSLQPGCLASPGKGWLWKAHFFPMHSSKRFFTEW